jgi:hypothetical protein
VTWKRHSNGRKPLEDVASRRPERLGYPRWILYKRDVYPQAVGLLKESASKLPATPVIQYPLGLASLKVSDKEGARSALSAAVNSPATFIGKDETKKALAELKRVFHLAVADRQASFE